MELKKITKDMVGCWLDANMGWHNNYRVIDRAEEYGMKVENGDRIYVYLWRLWRGSDFDAAMDDAFEEEYDPNGIDELVSQATEYLDSLAPEGYGFNWDMGELSLLCLCQIEGTEENMALLKTSETQCDNCKR